MSEGAQAVKPYYCDAKSGIVIYHGDCREILPTLELCDLLLTDPPYGISQDRGMGSGGYDGFGRGSKRTPKRYDSNGWDSAKPPVETMQLALGAARDAVVWGGNFFSDVLTQNAKWLVWDKEQTMPTYSDAELAWTTLGGNSVKMFRYNGSGIMAVEKTRDHPTQKPLALMAWCLSFFPTARTILDPFMGSGTTLRAAKDLGRSCVGIELEERYCEIAARRLQQEVLAI